MSDHDGYRRFTGRAEFEKAVNSLIGLIEGITIDATINESEVGFLNTWLDGQRIRADKHPFNEIFPVVEGAIADGILSMEERDDILWLCKKLTASERRPPAFE